MFQSYDLPDHSAHAAARLARLRDALRAQNLDGFLIPRADAHQGENVAPCDERLTWLTGFSGSAGLCAALMHRAALFVDGRYTLQARAQADASAFEIASLIDRGPETWLVEALHPGATLGLDPMLHTASQVERLRKAVEAAGAKLALVEVNPVDAIWDDRPPPPCGSVQAHGEALAGESAADKRARIGDDIARAGAEAAVLSLPDSIAWLLNIRGADVARAPAPLAFAILRADGTARLFANADKFDGRVRAHLGEAVEIAPPEAFGPALDALGGRPVLVDRDSAPAWVGLRLEAAGATPIWRRDPCILPKAIKNAAELAGARAAHLRDGAAMVRFLRWFSERAPEGGLTEIEAARKLEALRAEEPALRDLAFDTICGAGPNGAIVHYRVSRDSDRALAPGELLLIDSGGQYEDGTTDVTRTLAIGAPEQSARRLFTLVLKGMIAVSRARFPAGTEGRALDALARTALWRGGHDYDHGTGHGVGAFLNVHEGPQSISKRGAEALRPGMIVSNEPGCYLEGRFGIRIENLLAVTQARDIEGGARPMLGFETLTWVPIERALVDPQMLAPSERAWLDAYHAKTASLLGPLLDAPDRAWLKAACAPI